MDPSTKAHKRPMAFVRRVSLFCREIRESISPTAMSMLLESAGKLSEGQVSAGGRYFGCTMLTLDLAQLEQAVPEVCDVATAIRLARHLTHQESVLALVRQLAETEARRIARRKLEVQDVEVRVRTEGQKVFLDVDLEGRIAAVPAAVDNGGSR